MSSKPDITKLTVDDIFRAKEARRKRLANLPFDQKIQIVNKLRAASKETKGEKPIFASFLRTFPNFADIPIKEWDVVDEWYAKRNLAPLEPPFDKRPDIIAVTASGKRIGIELKSWINESEIKAAKIQEEHRQRLLKAIGEQPANTTKHIGYVQLSTKPTHFIETDGAEFREQLFVLVDEQDAQWSQKIDWDEQQVEFIRDFARFPLLEKYLDLIEIHSWPRFSTEWIQLVTRGGAYSPNEMLSTLSNALKTHTKDKNYNQELRKHAGLEELHLLIHYDSRAFTYNPPFAAPNSGFAEAAEFSSKVLAGDVGYFDRVFLSCDLLDHAEARRIA